jgi:hypothetical protein
MLNWYEKELMKDKNELDREKNELIKKIKGLKKEDIVPKQEKLSLWKRIKKVLMG